MKKISFLVKTKSRQHEISKYRGNQTVIRKGHEKQKSRAQSVKLAPTMAQRIAAEAYARENRDEGQPSMPAHARSVSLQDNGADVSDMMRDLKITSKDGKDDKDTGPPMNCKFHPGRVQSRAS